MTVSHALSRTSAALLVVALLAGCHYETAPLRYPLYYADAGPPDTVVSGSDTIVVSGALLLFVDASHVSSGGCVAPAGVSCPIGNYHPHTYTLSADSIAIMQAGAPTQLGSIHGDTIRLLAHLSEWGAVPDVTTTLRLVRQE